MRTTLTLDNDVHRAARQLARASGRRLGQVVSELARRGLEPPQLKIRRHRGSGLPTFVVPAGTPTLTAERVQRFLDDEGGL